MCIKFRQEAVMYQRSKFLQKVLRIWSTLPKSRTLLARINIYNQAKFHWRPSKTVYVQTNIHYSIKMLKIHTFFISSADKAPGRSCLFAKTSNVAPASLCKFVHINPQIQLHIQYNGTTLQIGHLDADCQLVSNEGRRQLSSATTRTCVVRQTYSNYGDRCFAAAGLKLWNSLPSELRQADISFQRFKQLLKTFLFGCWDRSALLLNVKAASHKFSYLLTLHYYVVCRLQPHSS